MIKFVSRHVEGRLNALHSFDVRKNDTALGRLVVEDGKVPIDCISRLANQDRCWVLAGFGVPSVSEAGRVMYLFSTQVLATLYLIDKARNSRIRQKELKEESVGWPRNRGRTL
jgi:hypothetical protein